MNSIGTLVRMANQIARNFAAMGDEAAARATAEHIRLYWEPRMIQALATVDPALLDPAARAALFPAGDGAPISR